MPVRIGAPRLREGLGVDPHEGIMLGHGRAHGHRGRGHRLACWERHGRIVKVHPRRRVTNIDNRLGISTRKRGDVDGRRKGHKKKHGHHHEGRQAAGGICIHGDTDGFATASLPKRIPVRVLPCAPAREPLCRRVDSRMTREGNETESEEPSPSNRSKTAAVHIIMLRGFKISFDNVVFTWPQRSVNITPGRSMQPVSSDCRWSSIGCRFLLSCGCLALHTL